LAKCEFVFFSAFDRRKYIDLASVLKWVLSCHLSSVANPAVELASVERRQRHAGRLPARCSASPIRQPALDRLSSAGQAVDRPPRYRPIALIYTLKHAFYFPSFARSPTRSTK